MRRRLHGGIAWIALAVAFGPQAAASETPRRVWYFTNFYSHYVGQDLGRIEAESHQRGIAFVNDRKRLFKYLPHLRADYGNKSRLSDDAYSGVILAIPEQQNTNDLARVREFIEEGGHLVVLVNGVSAQYARNVKAFQKLFQITIKHHHTLTRTHAAGVVFAGGQLGSLWDGLEIGSSTWTNAGLDACIIPLGEGWTNQVFSDDADGEAVCLSATRAFGEGQVLFQVAPNGCVGEEPTPGRLHHSDEFFFPQHLPNADNLEAFMKLVEFAGDGTVTPTQPAPLPSHEPGGLDQVVLHSGEVVSGKITAMSETQLMVETREELQTLDRTEIRSFQVDRSGWPFLLSGTIRLEDAGPAEGQSVDIYQNRRSYSGYSSSSVKTHRHGVRTDANGTFSVVLDIPGTYTIMVSPEKPYHYSSQTIAAAAGQSETVNIVARLPRQARLRWCYTRDPSRKFSARETLTGNSDIWPRGPNRMRFTENGLEDVDGRSDFLLLQTDDGLYIRNFDVCDSGHGLIDAGLADFDAIDPAPPDDAFSRPDRIELSPGKVILVKTYDGTGYAKMRVEAVDIHNPAEE